MAPQRVPLGVGILVTSAGGAFGALARWALTDPFPVAAGSFPWVTFVINVTGAGLLATLPLLSAARTRPWLGMLLGTGALGGFTTMSAASTETFVLLDHGAVGLAIAYGAGTLGASLLAVLLVDRLTTEQQRQDFASAEGDE